MLTRKKMAKPTVLITAFGYFDFILFKKTNQLYMLGQQLQWPTEWVSVLDQMSIKATDFMLTELVE